MTLASHANSHNSGMRILCKVLQLLHSGRERIRFLSKLIRAVVYLH